MASSKQNHILIAVGFQAILNMIVVYSHAFWKADMYPWLAADKVLDLV